MKRDFEVRLHGLMARLDEFVRRDSSRNREDGGTEPTA
jgi:hypothetical protein